MLLMKKTFFDAIRAGAKSTTLRYWQRPMVRPGSMHKIRGLGALRVDDVRPITDKDITDDDARADGLAGRAELTALLAELYTPSQRLRRTLYRVTFTYLGQVNPSSGDTPEPPPQPSA